MHRFVKKLPRLRCESTNRKSALLALPFFLAPLCTAAKDSQSLESIRQAVVAFISSESVDAKALTIQVGALDDRLRLPRCEAPIEAFRPPGAKTIGGTAIGVRCAGSWKIYVPARVGLQKEVLVASQSMARGELLDPEELRLEKRDVSVLLQGYTDSDARILGHRLKRPVRTGEVITPGMVEEEKIVRRGQQVTILASVNGIEVRMAGEALSDGVRDQAIKVRNVSSKRVVEGTVTGLGVVEIIL
ncbi:MAG: flagellar basal body P-ring formation chaperone FlgA [Gammaproteobacteria bacterium]